MDTNQMVQIKHGELMCLIEKISSLKQHEDIDNVLCSLGKIFDSLSVEQIKLLVQKLDIYEYCANLIESCLKNEVFRETLISVIEKRKELENSMNYEERRKFDWTKIDEKNKQLLRLFIDLSTFLLSFFLEYLNINQIISLRARLVISLKELIHDYNDKYDIATICFNINDILVNSAYISKLNFLNLVKDNNRFFKNLKVSNSLAICIFLILSHPHVMRLCFKKNITNRSEDHVSLRSLLSNIYGSVSKIEGGIEKQINYWENNNFNTSLLNGFVDSFRFNNEKITGYIIREISKNIYHSSDPGLSPAFGDQILQKIQLAKSTKENIDKYANANLSAYSGLEEDRGEWSNKIYLISYKMLSALEAVAPAKNNVWKISVAVRELSNWIDDIHQILNKYDLQDDWSKIIDFINQENNTTEWKSTFLTPVEESFKSDKVERVKEKEILFSVTKTILNMINAEGGSILVGLIEKPERIKRKEILEHTIEKNGKTFLDMNYELKLKGKSLDDIKLRIQDQLVNETNLTHEALNGYWDIEGIQLKEYGENITIYKINVKSSKEIICSFDVRGEAMWIAIRKRIDGRNTYDDPRNYLNVKQPVKSVLSLRHQDKHNRFEISEIKLKEIKDKKTEIIKKAKL